MAPAVDPHYYIPPDWIPITAIEKNEFQGHFSQNVYVPRRWIPETRTKVVICCCPVALDDMSWDNLPDYVRYIFGCIDSDDKYEDQDYEELVNTLEECHAIESANRFVGNLNILGALPSYNINTLDKEEMEKHVIVVCSFADEDGIPLVAKCDIISEKDLPNEVENVDEDEDEDENQIPDNNEINEGED